MLSWHWAHCLAMLTLRNVNKSGGKEGRKGFTAQNPQQCQKLNRKMSMIQSRLARGTESPAIMEMRPSLPCLLIACLYYSWGGRLGDKLLKSQVSNPSLAGWTSLHCKYTSSYKMHGLQKHRLIRSFHHLVPTTDIPSSLCNLALGRLFTPLCLTSKTWWSLSFNNRALCPRRTPESWFSTQVDSTAIYIKQKSYLKKENKLWNH